MTKHTPPFLDHHSSHMRMHVRTHTQDLQWTTALFPCGCGETSRRGLVERPATEDMWTLAEMETAGLFIVALLFLQYVQERVIVVCCLWSWDVGAELQLLNCASDKQQQGWRCECLPALLRSCLSCADGSWQWRHVPVHYKTEQLHKKIIII